MHLEGKVALVTGSGQGIGEKIALTLAGLGADVVVCDINEQAVEAVAGRIRELGRRALPQVADVADAGQVENMAKAVLAEFGRIDVLVNNAGITRDNLLIRMKEEEWDQVLRINLKGVFLCTKVLLKSMIKQRSGSIVNIASVVGVMGNAGQANYAASKGGVIAFSKTVAKEAASRGVRCNAIAPGFIRTAMTDKLPDQVKEATTAAIPLGIFGEAQDVADLVAFLASDRSKYITGQVINVDGGLVM